MPKAVSDTELLAAIGAAEQSALGTVSSTIASDRADAINRYLGKAYGDEQPGRSSVVSRDVSDVVEGVLANVLKPFVGGDEVVQFNPHGPEDTEQAQQETDYINYVALERNNGFLVLTAAVKDALLLRAGYVKCGWTTRDDVISETYQGMSEEEAALLMQDKDVEVVQHTEYADDLGLTLHDIKVRRKRQTAYVETMPVPSDEILVSERARVPSLQEVDFVQHRTHQTLSELRQAGYDVPDDIGDDENGETEEGFARQRFGQSPDLYEDETSDQSRRLVMFKESYLRIDRDGDGVAELRRVCQVGQNILADDECDIIPVACFAGILMPHQHLGLSVYDLVQDLAQIKTALMRGMLDNKYQSINQRIAVDVNRVNVDDALTSRPGGLIRVNGDPSGAVFPIVAPDTGATALQGLEYLDMVREQRSGFTRQSAGLNTDALVTNTVGGMEMQLSQSQLRLEMIARTIAETGMRDLFRIVHALTLKHSTKEEKVKLRNKWVTVNPREWVARTDLSISVGLGSSSQQLMVQHMMLILQLQDKAGMLGLVDPMNVFNACKKITNAIGFKDESQFFTPPQIDPNTGKSQMPPPKPDPSIQVAQINAQAQMQKAQMDQQGKAQELQAKSQLDAQKIEAESQAKQVEMQQSLALQASNDQRQNQLDQQKFAFEAAQAEREHQFKLIQMEKEFQFKYWEAQQKIEQQREASQLSAAASVEASKNKPKGNRPESRA